jgi:hypothetical protein
MQTWKAAAIVGLAALCSAQSASAITCYLILDRNDAVVYRDSSPPFDLSETQSPQRTALRQRGHHLMIAEFDNCYSVGYVSTASGGGTVSVDEIVMQLKPAISTTVGKPNYVRGTGGTQVTGF